MQVFSEAAPFEDSDLRVLIDKEVMRRRIGHVKARHALGSGICHRSKDQRSITGLALADQKNILTPRNQVPLPGGSLIVR